MKNVSRNVLHMCSYSPKRKRKMRRFSLYLISACSFTFGLVGPSFNNSSRPSNEHLNAYFITEIRKDCSNEVI